jgi:MGT family glycosyltransferase
VGRAVEPSSLEPIPENFSVAQFVPQLSVLKDADVFITHGGMNSISEAVMYGVPMIVVPNTVEQALNAARVEQLLGGIYLESHKLTVEQLQITADKMIADLAFGTGLERIRQSFLDAGGVQRAAEAIEKFKQRYDLN